MDCLIVDIETTTENRHNAGIVEIGAAWLDDREDPLAEAFTIQCRPREGCEIDPDALAVNGCTWLLSAGHPTEEDALKAFAQWLEQTAKTQPAKEIVMVGWNVAVFDWLILEAAWKRTMTSAWPFSFRTIDLHAVACADLRNADCYVPAGGISSRVCCEAYGLPPEPKPHRAMGGVAFEYALARKLL